MSKKNKQPLAHKEQTLAVDEVSDLTIDQINDQAMQVEAANAASENVLDKYIRKHRSEIERAKKAQDNRIEESLGAQLLEAPSPLDDLIESARQTLASTDEVLKPSSEDEATQIDQVQWLDSLADSLYDSISESHEAYESDSQVQLPLVAPDVSLSSDSASSLDQAQADQLVEEASKSSQKKKGIIIGLILALILALLLLLSQCQSNSQSDGSKPSSSTSQSASQTQAFETLYQSFFVDKAKTQLKNSQFKQIDQLTKALDGLKDQKDYQAYKTKTDELKAMIAATDKMNGHFDKPVIMDGKLDKNAKVKADAKLNFDKTTNQTLNKLLAEAKSLGESQEAARKQSASETASITSSEQAETAPSTSASVSSEVASPTTPIGGQTDSTTTTVPDAGNARVSNNPSADTSQAAYQWQPGVLDKVLNTLRARGNLTGDYILEPAQIINGHGWYNLYRADGTYLVSIDSQDGYFVGNAPGNADSVEH